MTVESDAMQAFYSRLYAIAKLCNHELTDEMVAMYDRILEPVGYELLNAGLDKLAFELGPRGQFPSMAAIQKAATGQPTPSELNANDDGEARLASTMVVAAVSKYGSVIGTGPAALERLARVRAFVGELAWAVVELKGGWNQAIGHLTNDSMSTFEAQFRELAKAKLARRRHGEDDLPPGLPAAGPRRGALGPISAGDVASLLPDHLRAKLDDKDPLK